MGVIWGSINVGMMVDWYSLCVRYLKKCDELPKLAVVLEIDPIPHEHKVQLAGLSDMRWYFISHGMPKIANINNDNARNLRYLIPEIARIAKEDDMVALIEQDVLMMKRDWVKCSYEALNKYPLVSAAGSYDSKMSRARNQRPKPYFSVFRAKDCEKTVAEIRTNRGSFVTIDLDAYRLDKHRLIFGKSHAFGTGHEVWGLHARGGTNHNGRASLCLEHFSAHKPKELINKISKTW